MSEIKLLWNTIYWRHIAVSLQLAEHESMQELPVTPLMLSRPTNQHKLAPKMPTGHQKPLWFCKPVSHNKHCGHQPITGRM